MTAGEVLRRPTRAPRGAEVIPVVAQRAAEMTATPPAPLLLPWVEHDHGRPVIRRREDGTRVGDAPRQEGTAHQTALVAPYDVALRRHDRTRADVDAKSREHVPSSGHDADLHGPRLERREVLAHLRRTRLLLPRRGAAAAAQQDQRGKRKPTNGRRAHAGCRRSRAPRRAG